MRVFSFLLVAVMAAYAQADVLFIRDFTATHYPGQDPIVPGHDVTLMLDSENSSPIYVSVPIPPLNAVPSDRDVFVTPENSSSYGFEWSSLEDVISGNEPKTTMWGPDGYEEYTSYLKYDDGGFFSFVDVDSLHFRFDGTARKWFAAAVTVNGEYAYAAPEPTTLLLLALALSAISSLCRSRYLP